MFTCVRGNKKAKERERERVRNSITASDGMRADAYRTWPVGCCVLIKRFCACTAAVAPPPPRSLSLTASSSSRCRRRRRRCCRCACESGRTCVRRLTGPLHSIHIGRMARQSLNKSPSQPMSADCATNPN